MSRAFGDPPDWPRGQPFPDAASAPTPVTPSRARSLFDWWFRDRRTGQITVAQFPNVPLWIFLGTVVLRRVMATGTPARTTVAGIGVAALAWWALDEVFRGVNPWRRLLGLGGCAFAAAGVVSMFR
jgi:hypothetical protein